MPIMRSLNKTTLSLLFLLIKIFCVTCPTAEQLQRCKDELFYEFKNVMPLDNLLHGFLNVAYYNVNYSEETEANENIYRGNTELKLSARNYYYDLYNTAIEMGIPEIFTPKEFCSTKHEYQEDECLSAIEAIGCGAHLHGPDCFEIMYFRWKKKDEGSADIDDTKNFSDEQLLEAIYNGCALFRNLSDEDLFEAFVERSDIIEKLSDENLLRIFYKTLYDANSSNSRTNRQRRRDYSDRDDIYGKSAYEEYLRFNIYVPEYDRLNRSTFDKVNLAQARINTYGVPHVSYPVICREYQRRKNIPKFYDNLYAEDICDKFRHSTWNTNYFKNLTVFCEDYLSEDE